MRHHERIKSLISLGLDGGVIGLDGGGTAAAADEGTASVTRVSGEGEDDQLGSSVQHCFTLGFQFRHLVSICLLICTQTFSAFVSPSFCKSIQ